MIDVASPSPAPYLIVQGDAARIPLPSASVDLVVGSPPYSKQRDYFEAGKDLGIARGTLAWVEWMLVVTAEALRVSRGAVIWIAAGPTVRRCYQPICEGLQWEWWQRGGECHLYRPCYWHRVGVPGSGQDQWFRHDIETVMCFKRPGPLPWADNLAMGHVPVWAPGGEMSNRLSDGMRVNQWGGHPSSSATRKADGTMQEPGRPSHVFNETSNRRENGERKFTTGRKRDANLEHKPKRKFSIGNSRRSYSDKARPHQHSEGYEPPAVANPGNLIHTNAGFNHLGHPLCHDNEAPMPEFLAEWFIRSHCPPGGRVLDPFGGSGTTCAVAHLLGRQAISMDLRRSQCDLSARRVREQCLDWDRPHRAKPPRKPKHAGGPTLFDEETEEKETADAP